MRPEPNNDIDLLLRQLSRRNGAPVSEIDEQHLDADELNSYVANALPSAARVRYTEHLADCSSCRKLVVELSAAYGPVAVLQPSEPVVAPSGLMSFLASLFSPMVMKYAVPAVGLMVIAVIGVVVMLRQGSGSSPVAQMNENETRPLTAQPESSTSGSASPGGDVAGKGESKLQPVAPAAKEDAVAKGGPVAKEAPPVVANQANQPADAAGAAVAEAPPPAPKVVQTDESVARAELNKEKKQEAAKTMAAAEEARERAAEPDRNAPPKKEGQVVTVTPGTTTRRDIAVRSAKSGETATGTAGASAGQDAKRAPAAGRGQSREEFKDSEAEAEVRSVAGRRFRKSGRVWIDTAYDDSKPIMTVARGSEQYRVLVADEPSIRRIADELDGEIVVVWKGRTYRIR
jgi:hypothetical protein